MRHENDQKCLAPSRKDAEGGVLISSSLRLGVFARDISPSSSLSYMPEVGEAADPPEEKT